MGKVNTPDTLLSYIKSLERRIATLETQQRLTSARISSGQLNVGAAGADDQIEIDASHNRVRFDTASGSADVIGSDGGVQLVASQPAGLFSFATQAIGWVGRYFTTLQVNRVSTDLSTTVASQIYADVQDSGGGTHRGSVSLSAAGSDHDGSLISLSADGGVVLYTNARSTDPPTPAAGTVVLYTKGTPSRLYYRDPGGTVHGPL